MSATVPTGGWGAGDHGPVLRGEEGVVSCKSSTMIMACHPLNLSLHRGMAIGPNSAPHHGKKEPIISDEGEDSLRLIHHQSMVGVRR